MTLTFFHSLFFSLFLHCLLFYHSAHPFDSESPPLLYSNNFSPIITVKVSSPPLSLSLTSPYYLHSAPLSQFYYTDTNRDRAVTHCEGSINISNPLCINSTFDCSKDDYTDSLYCAGPENNTFLFCKQENDLNGNMDSLYHRCNHAESFLDSLYVCGHDLDSTKNSFCPHNSGFDSIRNDDSLYSDARYTRRSLKLFTDPEPPTDINTLTEGDITPYKNIDMQTYITMRNLKIGAMLTKTVIKMSTRCLI